MKKYLLLIALLFLVFIPNTVFADDHRWYKKAKDFLSSIFPSNPKYCVNYEGEVYIVGEIFKTKNCKKGDKEFTINSSGQSGTQGPQGETGPKGDKGDKGDQGMQGEKGEKGEPGSASASGLAGWEKISTTSASTTEQLKTVTATCSENKKVLSGGFVVNSSTVTFYTVSNFPSADNAWTTSVHRSSTTTPWDLSVFAICANTN